MDFATATRRTVLCLMKLKLWIAVAGVVAVILVAWLLTIPVLSHWFPDAATRGQAGDAFGAINALFSGLAFAGVIVAIAMQSRELQLQREQLVLQRKELEETRAELKRQADAAEKSQLALERQRKAQLVNAAIMATIERVKLARAALERSPAGIITMRPGTRHPREALQAAERALADLFEAAAREICADDYNQLLRWGIPPSWQGHKGEGS